MSKSISGSKRGSKAIGVLETPPYVIGLIAIKSEMISLKHKISRHETCSELSNCLCRDEIEEGKVCKYYLAKVTVEIISWYVISVALNGK